MLGAPVIADVTSNVQINPREIDFAAPGKMRYPEDINGHGVALRVLITATIIDRRPLSINPSFRIVPRSRTMEERSRRPVNSSTTDIIPGQAPIETMGA